MFSRIPDATVSFFAAAATKAQHGAKAQHDKAAAEPPVLNAKAPEPCMIDGDEINPALRRSARQRAAQHAQQQPGQYAAAQLRPPGMSPSLSSSSVAAAVAVVPDVDDTGSRPEEEQLPEYQSQQDTMQCDAGLEGHGKCIGLVNTWRHTSTRLFLIEF